MPVVAPRRRRARPVADAPIDALLLRSEDLAKGWLLALLEDAPLEEASRILAAELTRDGPRLCDAVLRAIADDTDLRRLEPAGALRPLAARAGELAGAATPAAVSRAVGALQAAIWSALYDELRAPDADLVSALSERLTLVAELLRIAVLERAEPPSGAARSSTVLHAAASPPPPYDPAAYEPPPYAPSAHAHAPPSYPPSAHAHALPPRSWPPDLRPASAPLEPLWIEALEDEIRRSGGASLSLLLAELEDADRVIAVHARPQATATFSRFSGAVRTAVRGQDILVCESDARAWIIARDTSRAGAYVLGERIAEAVRGSLAWQGAPLAASVGVAVLGEDGRTSAELMQAAEQARFAAAASGVVVLRPQPGA
jgi:GGDEF domain-containing protein